MRTPLAVFVVLLLVPGSAATRSEAGAYRVDPSRSTVTIHVGKSGVLSFVAGHTHEVTGAVESGTIAIDRADLSRSHVHLVVPTSSLRVSPEGEPPNDVPKVQETMAGDKVLAVARYPQVVFDSTSVTGAAADGSAADVTVAGRLTIRGVSRPVTVRVHASFDGDSLAASGRFSIRQSAYGITPIKVAGVVAVKDAIDVEFSVHARRQ